MSRREAENIDVKNLQKNIRYQLVGGGVLTDASATTESFFTCSLTEISG